jgi:hypothetical protein
VASGRGSAAASSVSIETPVNDMPSLDHVVTQWMSPSYDDSGRAWISSHVHVVGVRTSPWTVKVHVAVSRSGVTSAVSTGQSSRASYWPGGRRGSRSARPRPENPRVNLAIPQFGARAGDRVALGVVVPARWPGSEPYEHRARRQATAA